MKSAVFPRLGTYHKSILPGSLGAALFSLGLVAPATQAVTEPDIVLSPAWARCAGENIARGKTVAGTGQFFVTPDGRYFPTVDFSTLTDGNFFPTSQWWAYGPIWWEEETDGGFRNSLSIYLGGTYHIKTIVIQTTINDIYAVNWIDENTGWHTAAVPANDGESLSLPTAMEIDALTDQFDIVAYDGNANYAVTEFQAYTRSLDLILRCIDIRTP
jgi:hypothetical protein